MILVTQGGFGKETKTSSIPTTHSHHWLPRGDEKASTPAGDTLQWLSQLNSPVGWHRPSIHCNSYSFPQIYQKKSNVCLITVLRQWEFGKHIFHLSLGFVLFMYLMKYSLHQTVESPTSKVAKLLPVPDPNPVVTQSLHRAFLCANEPAQSLQPCSLWSACRLS